jgi:hypothetical protein
MDVRILKEFVAEVLVVCANESKDPNGFQITWGLDDKALQAGAELGMTKEEMDEIQEKA